MKDFFGPRILIKKQNKTKTDVNIHILLVQKKRKKRQKKAFPDTGANLQFLAFAIHRYKHRLPALCVFPA